MPARAHCQDDNLFEKCQLAALIPLPRVNLSRFHGIFAPNSKHREAIIIKKSDKKLKEETNTEAEKRRARLKAVRLKRAFNIDINVCEACGGAVPINEISDALSKRQEPKNARDYLQAYLDYASKISDGSLDTASRSLDRMVSPTPI